MAVARDDLKSVRQRRYLARDFNSLKSMLFEYAKQYFPDRIQDFSESSLGGLFLELASAIGDNLSFYLDHQYGELDPSTAIENTNIERILRKENVPIVGASPALVPVTAYIEVPAEAISNTIVPKESAIPTILPGSIFQSSNGVEFILLESINFAKKKTDGTYQAEVKIGRKTSIGTPTTFTMALSGLCVSGKEITETTTVGTEFVPFRKIALGNANVSEIVSVTDGLGNTYYKVNSLAHDVVYRNVLNTTTDSALVKDTMKVVLAPYRYTASTDLTSRITTLTFGGGSADSLEDDVLPDPSDFALSLPYSTTFSRIPVNPGQLLQTKTLGVCSTNTTISITYRYGGGLDNNVPADAINTVKTLLMNFPAGPDQATASAVRGSVEVRNRIRSSGGEDAPSIDDLKQLIPLVKGSQERIASREDLMARVYTLPSNFGRVFRAAVRSNHNNPLSTQLFVISRDADQKLIVSPDTLKNNLKTYLNPYRMISDAIDILDARIVNLTFMFEVAIDPTLTRSTVLAAALRKLQTTFDIKNFHIDQPIMLSSVENELYTVPGVLSVTNMLFTGISGVTNGRTYSDEVFDAQAHTQRRVLSPPPGGIFEIRFPENDIIGRATL